MGNTLLLTLMRFERDGEVYYLSKYAYSLLRPDLEGKYVVHKASDIALCISLGGRIIGERYDSISFSKLNVTERKHYIIEVMPVLDAEEFRIRTLARMVIKENGLVQRAICLNQIGDYKGDIVGYRLALIPQEEEVDYSTGALKEMIELGRIKVDNLSIKDGEFDYSKLGLDDMLKYKKARVQ